jgi:hypothetical protein
LDAQICLLSWVSFGLEPASDGSRRLHLSSVVTLSRLGSSSTTTPSTSTVTSGTVCRPQQRPARCHPATHGPGGRLRAGPGRRILTRVGCALSRQWRFPAVLRHVAGRLCGSDLGGRVAWAAATVVRAGARCALLAGGVSWNCRPGGGALRPARRRSHGAASWRPGRVGRCDCRPGRGTSRPDAGGVFCDCRPGRGTLRPVRWRSHCAASGRLGRVGRCDCRPGWGCRTLFAGAVISPSVGRRAARYTRLPAGRGARRTLIAGGVFSPSDGQLAARSAQLLAGRGARRTLIAGGVFTL